MATDAKTLFDELLVEQFASINADEKELLKEVKQLAQEHGMELAVKKSGDRRTLVLVGKDPSNTSDNNMSGAMAFAFVPAFIVMAYFDYHMPWDRCVSLSFGMVVWFGFTYLLQKLFP